MTWHQHLVQYIWTTSRQKFVAPSDLQQQQLPSPLSPSSLNTDFVCFRGCLTTLMCTPFEPREDWRVAAVKFRGTIYLHKEETRLELFA